MRLVLVPIFFLVHLLKAYNLNWKSSLVYKIPNPGERSSYFGYSVAIRPEAHKYLNNSWAIAVGAPRANISGIAVSEPGTVYYCPLNGLCSMQRLLQEGNSFIFNNRRKYFSSRKDNAWIGASTSLGLFYGVEVLLVCGHRHTYQAVSKPLGVEQNNYLPVGICYLDFPQTPNIAPFKLTPLQVEAKAYYLVSKLIADYDWATGMAGISAHISNSGLLLGAPYVRMAGSVVAILSPHLSDPAQVANMTLYYKSSQYRWEAFSYYGYSVGSGYFFGDDEEWFAMGAPRAAQLFGRVFIFRFHKWDPTGQLIFHPSVLKGTSYGEYFGASISSADINGDGLDDLVVGAPTFSDSLVDQGRVYTFLGKKGSQVGFQPSAVIDGTVPHSRFGTCVSAVGDLDQDGFSDVVVGAPYEGDGGAIYLYRGSPRGLRLPHAQRILASDIVPALKGFGISISKAIDVDGDMYDDIIVGAYLSNTAVLLRSHPIVSLTPSITHPPFLDRRLEVFNITICVPYVGNSKTNVPITIGIDVRVAVDEELGRALVVKSNNSFYEFSTTTQLARPHCSDLSIKLIKDHLNGTFSDAIPVIVNVRLTPPIDKGAPRLVGNEKGILTQLPAIVNFEMSKPKVSAEIPFAGECGIDNVCQADIKLNCSFLDLKNGVFVLGSSPTVKLVAHLSNKGEPAHYPTLKLNMSGMPQTLVQSHSPCLQESEKFNCKMDTLGENVQTKIVFNFDTSFWQIPTSEQINLTLTAGTSSQNINVKDSVCATGLTLVNDAKLKLFTWPSHATISLLKKIPKTVNVTHHFEIRKSGVSGVGEVEVIGSIPTAINGTIFAILPKDDSPISVAAEFDMDEVKLGPRAGVEADLGEILYSNETRSFRDNHTLFLNCSSSVVVCSDLHFFFLNKFPPKQQVITVNLTVLSRYLKGMDAIKFVSNWTILNRYADNKDVSTTTSIVMPLPPEVVPSRVVALSIVGGAMFLGLLIPVLIKEGFFRRKQKEQMEAIKQQDLIRERFSMYGPPMSERKSSIIESWETVPEEGTTE